MERWELAYEDYIKGMKYKDIAIKYNVSLNTVKSWKLRKWNISPIKKSAHIKKEELQPVIKNNDLTEQQQMFCLFYLQHFNATKAYQQAYQCDYKTANSNAYLLMVNHGIRKELHRLKAELQQEVLISVKDLIKEYIKQAFADITDFTEFGQEIVEFDDGQTRPISFVRLKNSNEIDGTLVQEIKKGKDGVSVKLYDKQKAIGELMKYLGGDLLREAQIKKLELETGNKENDSAVISAFDDDIK
ncbi:terminase small subunit [Melissococcus plutonius]|uniref:terminase small subunit n=1 Tax=Melissococcus plutonius TaxID=33970 RepID=UPI003C2ACE87